MFALAVRDAANAQRPGGRWAEAFVVQDFCVFKGFNQSQPKICRGMRKEGCPIGKLCGKIRLGHLQLD